MQVVRQPLQRFDTLTPTLAFSCNQPHTLMSCAFALTPSLDHPPTTFPSLPLFIPFSCGASISLVHVLYEYMYIHIIHDINYCMPPRGAKQTSTCSLFSLLHQTHHLLETKFRCRLLCSFVYLFISRCLLLDPGASPPWHYKVSFPKVQSVYGALSVIPVSAS